MRLPFLEDLFSDFFFIFLGHGTSPVWFWVCTYFFFVLLLLPLPLPLLLLPLTLLLLLLVLLCSWLLTCVLWIHWAPPGSLGHLLADVRRIP